MEDIEQTPLGPLVRNSEITVGHIRKIIAELPDDAMVEVAVEGSYETLFPSGASVCPAVNCRDGLQLFIRHTYPE